MPVALTPYVDRLRHELAAIRVDLENLLEGSNIRYVNPNSAGSGVFFVGAADWGWSPSDPDTSAQEMALLARYGGWFERLRLLFPHPTPDVASKMEETDEFVRRWIKRPDSYDHTIPRKIDAAKERATRELDRFEQLLDLAARPGARELRLVPDTNALIRNLQSDYPGGSVVLVTSDLNLQNKADAVGVPYLETPPPAGSLPTES